DPAIQVLRLRLFVKIAVGWSGCSNYQRSEAAMKLVHRFAIHRRARDWIKGLDRRALPCRDSIVSVFVGRHYWLTNFPPFRFSLISSRICMYGFFVDTAGFAEGADSLIVFATLSGLKRRSNSLRRSSLLLRAAASPAASGEALSIGAPP